MYVFMYVLSMNVFLHVYKYFYMYVRQVSKRFVEAYTLHVAKRLLMRRLIMSCLEPVLDGATLHIITAY